MEEKDALKIEQEIEQKKKLPQEEKDAIDKTFFYNNIMAILMMIYFTTINVSYIFMNEIVFVNLMKYISLIIGILTIITFEVSYRKDNLKIALIGIELLVYSVLSVCIPYIYLYTNPIYKNVLMIFPIFFAIYYIVKTIVVYIIRKTKYANSISDIKEIINYSENKSYIDEDSVKTLKENKKRKEQELKLKKEREKNIQNKKIKQNNNSKKVKQNSKKQVKKKRK